MASTLPCFKFCAIVPENKIARCKTIETVWRKLSRFKSRKSCPLIVIDPVLGSNSLGINCASVDLPEPVAPTTPTISPVFTLNEISSSVGSSSKG